MFIVWPQSKGAAVEFDKVLLVDNDGAVKVGAPTVEGAKSSLRSSLSSQRRTYHRLQEKKKKKDNRKRNGHRQCFTEVLIKDIVA